VEAGETVRFTTREASDAGSGLDESSFAWAFCDGCAPGAAGRTASRSFDTPGSYQVTLSAEDVAGNRGVDSFILTVTPPGQAPPAAPPAQAQTEAPAAVAPARTPGRQKYRVLASVRIAGKSRVGAPIRVRVKLKRRAKVTFEVLSRPGERQTLLKRWAPRSAFRKGATIYRLSPPTRPATRVLRVTAGGETRTLTFRIRR